MKVTKGSIANYRSIQRGHVDMDPFITVFNAITSATAASGPFVCHGEPGA